MATLSEVKLTCDLCGNPENVHTQTIGLDGKIYEIDLCQEDNKSLNRVVAHYIAKGRKIASRPSSRRNNRKPRPETGATHNRATASARKSSGQGHADSTQEKAKSRRSEPQATRARGPKAKASGSRAKAKTTRSEPQRTESASKRSARSAGTERKKAIFVYGILPADIEVAAEVPGIGEHPGLLQIVRSDGLAALISEVEPSGRLGSPEDLRTRREILDGTAAEVPVLPLRFGTILASVDAVADELLAAHYDEFADALAAIEGRAEFVAVGRYVDQASAPEREQAQRALEDAMEGLCVASVTRELAHERDAVHIAFLVDVSQESEVVRVIENLAQEWEGRIELELLGPTAAYDFVKAGETTGLSGGRVKGRAGAREWGGLLDY